ncbi:MAG: hypothetical protein ACJAYE_001091 [Candidatus Azotimanducaceae bacterium]|jgi:hypothetical protein
MCGVRTQISAEAPFPTTGFVAPLTLAKSPTTAAFYLYKSKVCAVQGIKIERHNRAPQSKAFKK